MPDNSYWEQRQIQKYLAGEKKVNAYYKDLKKSFEQAKKEIQSVISDFYWRYAEENGLSYAVAQKRLSKAEIGDLQAFMDKVNQHMGEYNQELNNMSIKARIARYQALEKQIDALLQDLYSIDYQAKGEDLLKDVYTDSYYRTWFNIDQYHGFHAEFAQVAPAAVEELINYPFNGADFSTRLWKQKDHMLQKLSESITTMLVQGKNPKVLADDFAKTFSTKEYEAYRLLHTESSFIMEQASQKAYQEDGVDKYQWLATLGSGTCEECRPLDKKIFKVGDGVVGLSLTPKHIFCRCTTAPYYDDMETGTRIVRDVETGESYEVPADMTYREWYKKYVESNPAALLAEKKWRNRYNDKKQYKNYKDVLGSEIPPSFDDFQNLKYNNIKVWGERKGKYRKLNAYNKTIAKEPAITKDLKEIANNTKTDLVGLEYRIKSKESYLRKINTDSNNSLDSEIINDTILKTNDVIRYTYQSTPDNLVKSYNDIVGELTKKGYTKIKVKNSWGNKFSPYKGINCVFSDPNGQKFELQFHTPESFKLKNGTLHELYERYRVLLPDSEEAKTLMKKMIELSSGLKTPKDIEVIK